MAIIFTPKSGAAFTIGGQASAPTNGVAGPFANLSISKEITRQDGFTLGARWTINITGTALITDAASQLARGVRQGKLFDIQKELLFSSVNQQGILDIDAYGGTSELLFNNAVLQSVDAAEADESSMGTQNQPYSFTFVSVDGDGTLSPEVGKGSAIKWIESFEESWDVSVEATYSGTFTGDDADTKTDYKTYTISHTISAQAIIDHAVDNITDNNPQMSYTKAKAFVEERLVDNPLPTAAQIVADPTLATLMQDERGVAVGLDVPTGFTAYNHVRQRSQSIAAGSYNVTDTWVASKYPAIYTVEYSYNGDVSAEYDTVDVNLTAEGFDTKHPETDETQDKYTNALINWTNIKTAAQRGAATFYTTTGGTGTLRTGVLRSVTEMHNETDGNLSFSCTLDDATINYPGEGVVSESLSITYDNTDAGNNIVAIIPVLAKADGPVIQDMGTTNEKSVSVALDLQMDKENRTNTPDTLTAAQVDAGETRGNATQVVEAYKPAGSYRRSRSENWNPYNGQYNLSMDWVYVDVS